MEVAGEVSIVTVWSNTNLLIVLEYFKGNHGFLLAKFTPYKDGNKTLPRS